MPEKYTVKITPQAQEQLREIIGYINYALQAPGTAIEMVSLLRYASNNINQIARRMNESGRIYDTDLEQVVQNQEQLWDMANGILTRLAAIK